MEGRVCIFDVKSEDSAPPWLHGSISLEMFLQMRYSLFYFMGGDFGSDTWIPVLLRLRRSFFNYPHFLVTFLYMRYRRYVTLWCMLLARNRQESSDHIAFGPVALHSPSLTPVTLPQTCRHRYRRASPVRTLLQTLRTSPHPITSHLLDVGPSLVRCHTCGV